MAKKDWLKFKPYTHLTPKTTIRNQSWIREYVANPEKVKHHQFYPFLHYSKIDKKFTRPKVNGKKEAHRLTKTKTREIFYANHLDGHVYAYYSNILNEKLNKQYSSDASLMESVTAYRSIPFNKKRNKCNIDFANEVFSFIKKSKEPELAAVCLDVSSYFDTINHKILKKKWANLLNRVDLPPDHYQIYRAITRFSYLEISDIINATPEYDIKNLEQLKIKMIDGFFRNGTEFEHRVIGKGLLRIHRDKFGIPQGSPISAVLSNLYLIDFDKLMVKLADMYDGLYRRYSDDIVFVCNPKWIEKIKLTISNFLTDELLLKIQPAKTQVVEFKRSSIDEDWKTTLIEQGAKFEGRPLTYLGFDFDGKNIRIKQKSISSYYRKTKRLIRRSAYFAYKTKRANRAIHGDPWIYRTRIYRLKTHLGSRKKHIDNKVFWGNYLSYTYNASKIMKEPKIKKQMRNHWRIVEGEIEKFNIKYGLEKSK